MIGKAYKCFATPEELAEMSEMSKSSDNASDMIDGIAI